MLPVVSPTTFMLIMKFTSKLRLNRLTNIAHMLMYNLLHGILDDLQLEDLCNDRVIC